MIAFVLKLMLPPTPFKIVLKLLFTLKFGGIFWQIYAIAFGGIRPNILNGISDLINANMNLLVDVFKVKYIWQNKMLILQKGEMKQGPIKRLNHCFQFTGVELPISSALQWFTAKPPEMQPQDKLITVDTVV